MKWFILLHNKLELPETTGMLQKEYIRSLGVIKEGVFTDYPGAFFLLEADSKKDAMIKVLGCPTVMEGIQTFELHQYKEEIC